MSEKLRQYHGCLGRLHEFGDIMREKYLHWRENNRGIFEWLNSYGINNYYNGTATENLGDFSHIYRKKTKAELIRISAAVMGIEFSYAAETAFVSPILLKIGIEHKRMTLIWGLSPLIGFFVTPILGSLSDRCQLKFGRRRPFICMMSLGVLLGLVLVPNGESLGYILGDTRSTKYINSANSDQVLQFNGTSNNHYDTTNNSSVSGYYTDGNHPWGIIITILGTILLDFDADACQSPARAYLLDITVPDDHARGLSTFTIMAGLGGFFGYALGGVNWDETILGNLFGGNVRAVFTVTTIFFIICVSYTVTSFKEIPLYALKTYSEANENNITGNDTINSNKICYGSMENDETILHPDTEYESLDVTTDELSDFHKNSVPELNGSMLLYLKSIISMPRSIKILCLTNLFSWMAHICYSLYFTDFVGEAVFKGSPMAAEESSRRKLYESGVRFGCWGMSMYSLSCACYSMKIENLIKKFGAKKIYIGGLLTYSLGMFFMAITRSEWGVLIFSSTAGIMYSTLFTMPYLIIARYHTTDTFDISEDGREKTPMQIRGLGTDIAIISSMVFLAQFLLSLCMGSIVSVTGTTTTIISVASTLALFGAISASQVMYLDL